MIKKYWAYILLGFSILFFIYKKLENPNKNVAVKTIKMATGWGYEIYINDTIFIKQNTIPAVSGNKIFATKEDAEKVGNFVLYKMKTTQKKLPQVTVAEIDSLKIKM